MRLRLLTIFIALAAVAASLALTATASSSTTAARAGCPAPGSVSSYHVYSLFEHGGIGCDHAKHLLIENLAHHRYHNYKCNHNISGRNVHMHCTSLDNGLHQYSASYAVH